MSTAHHGNDDDRRRMSEIIERLASQGDGTAKRAYPDGRMGAHDEGELAFAVGVDARHGTVVLNFNKPVTWMGMAPADAVRMAEALIKHARSIATEPLTVNVGG